MADADPPPAAAPKRKRGRPRKGAKPIPEQDEKDNPKYTNREPCPYCGLVLATVLGHTYHVKNQVCVKRKKRQEEKVRKAEETKVRDTLSIDKRKRKKSKRSAAAVSAFTILEGASPVSPEGAAADGGAVLAAGLAKLRQARRVGHPAAAPRAPRDAPMALQAWLEEKGLVEAVQPAKVLPVRVREGSVNVGSVKVKPFSGAPCRGAAHADFLLNACGTVSAVDVLAPAAEGGGPLVVAVAATRLSRRFAFCNDLSEFAIAGVGAAGATDAPLLHSVAGPLPNAPANLLQLYACRTGAAPALGLWRAYGFSFGPVWDVRFGGEGGRCCAMACGDGAVRTLKVDAAAPSPTPEGGAQVLDLGAHCATGRIGNARSVCTAVCWLEGGPDRLLGGYNDGSVALFAAAGEELLPIRAFCRSGIEPFVCSLHAVRALAPCPVAGAEVFAVLHRDAHVALWDAAAGENAPLAESATMVSRFAFATDLCWTRGAAGPTLFSAPNGPTVHAVRMDSGEGFLRTESALRHPGLDSFRDVTTLAAASFPTGGGAAPMLLSGGEDGRLYASAPVAGEPRAGGGSLLLMEIEGAKVDGQLEPGALSIDIRATYKPAPLTSTPPKRCTVSKVASAGGWIAAATMGGLVRLFAAPSLGGPAAR